MQFNVRALKVENGASELVSLALEALSEADARAQLAAKSLRPVSLVASRSGITRARRQAFSVLLFSQELHALLEAGLSIVEALDTLAEQASTPGHGVIFAGLRKSIGEGNSFSRALQETSNVFPPVYVGVVRAAETTSNLPQALRRYIDYQSRVDAIRAKLVSSAVYPLILLITGSAVTLFLMIYVVPRFAGVYQGSGRPLPWMSAVLLQWGALVSTHTMWVLIFFAGLAAALVFTWTTLRRNGGLALVLPHVPGLGERVRIYSVARLYMTLGMLIEGGITAVTALAMARETVFAALRSALDAAARRVSNGEPLSAAFAAHGLSTPVALRFLRVGERSGNLGEMLMRSATYYDAEIARWIDRFTRSFEPLLMAAIGVFVGLIVVLLYMPIFDLAGSFQ